jgi:uncharacterized short protein YbdD (DUF466 family)
MEKLYCKCERVIEGSSEEFPKYLANVVMHHGGEILDETGRRRIIEECESKIREYNKHIWKLKRAGDKYTHKERQLLFWAITLPNSLEDFDGFYSVVKWNAEGMGPVLSRKKEEMLLESYGSPQLKKYVEEMRLKAESKIPKFEEDFTRNVKELRELLSSQREAEKSIRILKDFGSLEKSIGNEEFNPSLSETFKQRILLARVGLQLRA